MLNQKLTMPPLGSVPTSCVVGDAFVLLTQEANRLGWPVHFREDLEVAREWVEGQSTFAFTLRDAGVEVYSFRNQWQHANHYVSNFGIERARHFVVCEGKVREVNGAGLLGFVASLPCQLEFVVLNGGILQVVELGVVERTVEVFVDREWLAGVLSEVRRLQASSEGIPGLRAVQGFLWDELSKLEKMLGRELLGDP